MADDREREPWKWNDGLTIPAEAVAPERFDRAAHDPEHARALTHQPHVPPNDGRWWLGVFIIGFGLFLLFAPMMGRTGVFLMVLMVLMGLFAIYLGVLSMWMSNEFDAAPIQRQVVVMLAHHIHEQQGTKGIVYRHHRMLLALRTQEVVDVSCSEELVRRIKPGDLGMAFLKLAVLVDFIPLRDDCRPTAAATATPAPPSAPA